MKLVLVISIALIYVAGFHVTVRADGFRAGCGKVKITPESPVWLAGYESRNRPSEGVAADLYARALAINDGKSWTVLVAADVIDFDPVGCREIKTEARKRFGLREERILLVGSHTHSGPEVSSWGTSARIDLDKERRREAYFRSLKPRILDAIGSALRDAATASIGVARGQAKIGTYRRVKRTNGTWGFGADPNGPIDPDLPVMRVLGENGVIRAIVFTFACHCTSITNGNEGFYEVHPDWAIACSMLEEKYPGATVLFLTGCGADIDPTLRGPLSSAVKNGQSITDSLDLVIKQAAFERVDSDRIKARIKRIRLPLEKPDRGAFEKMARDGTPDQRHFASEKLREMDQKRLKKSVEYPIHLLTFGKALTMVCLPGEVCVEYALRLKKELGETRTWPIGYANEVVCYIPSERVLKENGYESGWSLATGRGIATAQMAWGGWGTPFAFGIEDRIVNAVKDMVRK